MKLINVNFCLSNRCNASCIWCPESRGTKHNIDMPFDLAKKIIDEIADSSFPYKIEMMHISENGEALYNKDFLPILRYIKKKLPKVSVNLLSNFGLMTKDISYRILKENLLSSIQVNLDGHDEESYKAVKGISYSSVIKNVKSFLKIREQLDPNFDFCINVMTAFEYAVTVQTFFESIPDRVNGLVPYSDFDLTVKSLKKIVPDNVRIRKSKPGLWAERKLITSGLSKIQEKMIDSLSCPQLARVETEAFIAPNGDWYACCVDDNQDLVLGNLQRSSIVEIFNSQKRLDFIKKLKEKKFEEIGYPCNTVVCCQTISLRDDSLAELKKNYEGQKIIMMKSSTE